MLDKVLIQSAYDDIEIIRSSMLEVRNQVDENEPRYKSLLNLYQYLRLRDDDWTQLQEKLFLLSLSSLGRSYSHISASLDTLHDQLAIALGKNEISEEMVDSFHHLNIQDSITIASRNAQNLFGGQASSMLSKQSTSLMVTLPSNAMENDGSLIRKLVESKVKIFRINTAHDTPSYWKEMADLILEMNKSLDEKEKVKIFVDLAGPKIRTGKIAKSDLPIMVGSNKVAKELLIYHGDEESKAESKDIQSLKNIPAQIVVNKHFYKKFENNSVIKVKDMNGKKAKITVKIKYDDYSICEIDKKVFLDKSSFLKYDKQETTIKNILPQTQIIRVFVGDELVITQSDLLGRPALLDDKQNIVEPAIINCSYLGVIENVKVGEKVYIDDGKVGLKIVKKLEDRIYCQVISAKQNGVVIKEEKGINFPSTYIKVPALTELDKINLDFVIDFADSVSLSFCQSAQDVKELQDVLHKYGKDEIGIIAKIETKQAVSKIPEVLTQLLKSKNSGVMIARGDLAIEVGFENLAYIQESLLNICNAAHIPVVWATQVLESKMKNNLPSRAEITDAAMSSRAECVMLNKGPFAFGTIDVLTKILHEMHKIFNKNRQLLRRETIWEQ